VLRNDDATGSLCQDVISSARPRAGVLVSLVPCCRAATDLFTIRQQRNCTKVCVLQNGWRRFALRCTPSAHATRTNLLRALSASSTPISFAALFGGQDAPLARLVYIIVGASGVYQLVRSDRPYRADTAIPSLSVTVSNRDISRRPSSRAGADLHQGREMASKFSDGDRVAWNTSQGQTSGKIVKKLTSKTRIKGQTAMASKDDPQYLVESEKTGCQGSPQAGELKKR
jgi:hypothetical protein